MAKQVSANSGTVWLQIGGWLSLVAAALHLAIIVGGPDWYRFFGAGEGMAQAAERGEWTPVLATLGIATVLAIWAAYAFSGAGAIVRLPLLRTGLCLITAIYLGRAAAFVPLQMVRPDLSDAFALWSSLIVLVFGLTYAIGTWRAWPHLRPSNGLP